MHKLLSGAEVTAKDNQGLTALIYAVRHENAFAFPYLAEELTLTDNKGRSAYDHAIEIGSSFIKNLSELYASKAHLTPKVMYRFVTWLPAVVKRSLDSEFIRKQGYFALLIDVFCRTIIDDLDNPLISHERHARTCLETFLDLDSPGEIFRS